jgi:Uma2 family endonuclease
MADQERPPNRPATYQDVIDAPEHLVAEILDGELLLSPRPAPQHAVTTGRLYSIIEPAYDQGFGGPGGWTILIEPELHIGPDVVVPDLAGWKRERMPELPEEASLSVAPDWVCEVLSPSTETIDRGRKLRIYAREGVSYLWLVNPVLRLMEVYKRQGTGWLDLGVHGDADIVRAEPFEMIEIQLFRLWARIKRTNGEGQR